MEEWWARFPWYEGVDSAGAPTPTPTVDLSALLPLDGKKDDVDAPVELPQPSTDALATPREESTVMESPDDLDSASAAVEEKLDGEDLDSASAAVEEKMVGEDWSATGGVNPALKGEIQTDIKEKVKHWFSYRKTVANRKTNNPFAEWLKGFRRPGVPPKKLALHKFYMQQEEYSEAIDELFNEKWPSAGLDPRFALDFRCKCAQQLLDLEPEDVLQELIEEQTQQHEEATKDYEKRVEAVGNPETLDDEGRRLCRENLAQVVQPFLDGVAKLTGFHVTLLAGKAPEEGSNKFALTT
ncbi:hypothetical protein B0H11DRAFT_2267517 [Mycena galericulata]|nr:hypothetical protein B0H11DRAFT_2267517 [Mycena galericulata]